MNLRLNKTIIVIILVIFLSTTSIQPLYAFDASRFFTWLMFLSGVGSSAASAVLKGQANVAYDKYMHTAIQDDMENFIDEYDEKHQQSIIASRVGLGMVIGAIMISLIDAAYIPKPETQEPEPIFGGEIKIPRNEILASQIGQRNFILGINGNF
ncbi:hypothetical protein GF312_01455 [Candidatus Poribacteria bacterium]|nr:hypothetical protein [Candidatus Poribacteria bacterium]